MNTKARAALVCAGVVFISYLCAQNAPVSTQPIPYYLQKRGITNVVGTCTGRMGSTLIVSNQITMTVKVQTGGGLVKMRNGTLMNTPARYGTEQRKVPLIVHLRGYPLAGEVKPGDLIRTTGVPFASGGGFTIVDYYKAAPARTFQ